MPPKKKQRVNDEKEEEDIFYETKIGTRLSKEASKQNDVKDTHEPYKTGIKKAFQDAKVDKVIIDVLQDIIVGYVGKAFISRWSVGEVVHPRVGPNTPYILSMGIRLPLVPGAHDFTVDWGDGKSNRITHSSQAEATHVYDAAGEYEVHMFGLIEGISFQHTRHMSSRNIIDISHWGDVKLGTDGQQLSQCRNLNVSATDAPNLNHVTSMEAMFWRAVSLGSRNCDFSNWNTGNVTNMSNMFCDATSFNGDISRFDTSAVTDMSGMFVRAIAFNGDLRAWNVTAVTNSEDMFTYARSFNHANKPRGL